jgi:hypothetical protein
MTYLPAVETEITREVWSSAVVPRPGHHDEVEISVESSCAGVPISEDMIIFSGVHSEFNRARARLAIRAPTFYRLLEEVLSLGLVDDALAHVIQSNLHRATPSRYPMPQVKPRRETAWEKLLSDDEV